MVHRELSDPHIQNLPKAGLSDFFYWLLGRRKRYRVAGLSMEPTLLEGWTVLVEPSAYKTRLPEIGEVVLAQLPGCAEPSIKRVHSIAKEGVDLRGDNGAQSTDSVTLGRIDATQILGQVICTFP
jgi:nickel-type superoxide dismutase maturation protease